VRTRVQINYKSGQSIVVKCKEFSCKYRGSTLVELKWEGINSNPLYIGIDDIESVWEL
jgi:hypothetical protein